MIVFIDALPAAVAVVDPGNGSHVSANAGY